MPSHHVLILILIFVVGYIVGVMYPSIGSSLKSAVGL
jgi:hypothetical protein